MRFFTKAQVEKAVKARQVQASMGFPVSSAMQGIVDRGVNFQFTSQDIRNADIIFGSEPNSRRGTTAWRQAMTGIPIRQPDAQPQNLEVAMDIMFVNGIPFIVGVTRPLNYIMVGDLDKTYETKAPARQSKIVEKSILEMVGSLKSRNFNPILLTWDGEKAVTQCTPALQFKGLQVQQVAAGAHVSVVERVIRSIKNRFRAVLLSLPYVLTALLTVMAVLFVVRCLNMQVSATSMSGISPREAVQGLKTNGKTDFRFSFG